MPHLGERTKFRSYPAKLTKPEGALRQLFKDYGTHYHQKCNNQGRGNKLLIRLVNQEALGTTSIHSRERLGGLLKNYYREAA